MRYILIASILFVCSCKSVPVPIGLAAAYKPKLSEPVMSTIRVKTVLSYDSLFGRYLKVGQQLISANSSSSLGFPYSGTLDQKVSYRMLDANRMQFNLPIKWEAKPELAGISAGTLYAKSMVDISLHLQGRTLATYQIDDLQLNNQWREKPVVKVLGFPIQVSGLIDQFLTPKIPVLATELKGQVNLFMSPGRLSTVLGSDVRLPAGLSLSSLAVDFQDLQFSQEGLQGNLLVQTRLTLGSSFNSKSVQPLFKPLTATDNVLAFASYFTFDEIRGMLATQLKCDVSQISLQLSSDSHELICGIKGVGKPDITFRFTPLLLDSSTIGIQVQEVEFVGLGFWRSLVKRNLSRRITAGIHRQRMGTDQLMKQLPSQVNGLNMANIKLSLDSINYSKDSIQVLGRLAGDWTLRK